MKNLLVSLVSVVLFHPLSATPDVKGRVVDGNGSPLPYATVALLSHSDSTVIAGTCSSEDGTYVLETESGEGLLKVALVGYRTAYHTLEDGLTFTLNLDAEALGGAVVSAVMPKTKVTSEGLQTSVRGTVLENAGTANDVLARTPGIMKASDGLEVVGKGTPLVYVNGRKLTDVTELERIQSSDIQSVEVISNPGAQYDASVRAVVRIRTVRRDGEGFGFNLTANDEQSLRSTAIPNSSIVLPARNNPYSTFNMNYRHRNVDIFAGTDYSRWSGRQDSELYQKTLSSPTSVQDGWIVSDYLQQSLSFNGGLNWQIAENHSVGFKVESGTELDYSNNQILAEKLYIDGKLEDELVASGKSWYDRKPVKTTANIYYNGCAGKLGIDFNADFFGVSANESSHTDETATTGDASVDNSSVMSDKLYAAKLVLSYPIWKGMLQAGTEETFSRIFNEYSIKGALTEIDASKSSVKENNIAAFLNYSFSLQKVGYISAGLRYEHVGFLYSDLVSDGSFDRKYDNFFPSLSYSNAFGPIRMMASFSVKTLRPSFYYLSDAIQYNSRYVLQSGNSQLSPQQFSDANLFASWKFLNLVMQYSRMDNTIVSWSSPYREGTGVVMVKPRNINDPLRSLSAYLNLTPTVGIWNLNGTAGIIQQWLSITDAADPSDPGRVLSFSDRPMFFAQMQNTFSVKNNWQFEAGLEWHSPGYSRNLSIINHYLDVTAAVQKSFLDGNLVLRLSGEDLAGLARNDIYSDFGAHIIRQTNLMDTQRVKFSVRYKFNSAQSKYKGTGAGRDAVDRMK